MRCWEASIDPVELLQEVIGAVHVKVGDGNGGQVAVVEGQHNLALIHGAIAVVGGAGHAVDGLTVDGDGGELVVDAGVAHVFEGLLDGGEESGVGGLQVKGGHRFFRGLFQDDRDGVQVVGAHRHHIVHHVGVGHQLFVLVAGDGGGLVVHLADLLVGVESPVVTQVAAEADEGVFVVQAVDAAQAKGFFTQHVGGDGVAAAGGDTHQQSQYHQ